jgi:hypothetical protein
VERSWAFVPNEVGKKAYGFGAVERYLPWNLETKVDATKVHNSFDMYNFLEKS